jgi:magnesium-transporting ATPase (P-type)
MLSLLEQYYPIVFVWLSSIAAAFSFQKPWPSSFKWLAFSVVFMALIDTSGTILAAYNIKTHFLYNILYTVNFVLIANFYYSQLSYPIVKRIARAFIYIFPLFVLANGLFIQGFSTLHTYSYVVGGSFIVAMAVAYLWELYISEDTQNIFQNPAFWFSISWLLFFAVSVPYLGMLNYLWSKVQVFTTYYYYIVYIGASILYNLGLIIGFLCKKATTK